VHLHCLAVEVEGLLGDRCCPVGKVLLGNLDVQAAEIAQPVLLLVFGNPLEGLLVIPCRADAVNPAVVPMIVASFTQGDLLGYGMFGLGLLVLGSSACISPLPFVSGQRLWRLLT